MAGTTRITVTLPTEQVAELKRLTDNVSGCVAEAVACRIRHQLLGEELRRYAEEHGLFGVLPDRAATLVSAAVGEDHGAQA